MHRYITTGHSLDGQNQCTVPVFPWSHCHKGLPLRSTAMCIYLKQYHFQTNVFSVCGAMGQLLKALDPAASCILLILPKRVAAVHFLSMVSWAQVSLCPRSRGHEHGVLPLAVTPDGSLGLCAARIESGQVLYGTSEKGLIPCPLCHSMVCKGLEFGPSRIQAPRASQNGGYNPFGVGGPLTSVGAVVHGKGRLASPVPQPWLYREHGSKRRDRK